MFNEGFFLTGLQENCKKKKEIFQQLVIEGGCQLEFAFNILYESEASIDKASEGEIVVVLLRTLSNTVYGSLRLALWVKFDNQKGLISS
jgi:hypothetical protein